MENVLITGASHRLGGLIAEDLAAYGCFIWIHYHTHEQEAFELKERINESGGNAECICADLRVVSEMDQMMQTISESPSGKLTTLIHNASIFPKGKLGDTSPDDWDQIMNVNLKAVWYLSSRFAGTFTTAKRIITIGDAGAEQGLPGHAVYALSKNCLSYLTRQMAVEFAPDIRVNLLQPGFVLQAVGETYESWTARVEKTLIENQKITDEFVRGIEFLMTDPGMTGSELRIDNGLHLYGRKK